jgi:hypothetical protein
LTIYFTEPPSAEFSLAIVSLEKNVTKMSLDDVVCEFLARDPAVVIKIVAFDVETDVAEFFLSLA